MKEWCMEHPWMTFFLILALLETVDIVAKAFSRNKNEEE